MQKYNKFHKLMLNYHYLMFKMREFTIILHKITDFKHFRALNSKFFCEYHGFLRKKYYFCRELTTITYHGRTHFAHICVIRIRRRHPVRRA